MSFDEKFQLVDHAGDPLKNMRIQITKANGAVQELVTDSAGKLPLQQGFGMDQLKIRVLGRVGGGAAT